MGQLLAAAGATHVVPDAAYLGDQALDSIYQGAEKVWPGVLLLDTFTRPDGPVGSPDIGPDPSAFRGIGNNPPSDMGNWAIIGNLLGRVGSANESKIVWDTHRTSYHVEVTQTVFGDDGVIVRFDPVDNAFVIVYPNSGTNRLEMYTYQEGVYAKFADGSPGIAFPITISIDVTPMTVEATASTGSFVSASTTDYADYTWVGLRSNNTTTTRYSRIEVTP